MRQIVVVDNGKLGANALGRGVESDRLERLRAAVEPEYERLHATKSGAENRSWKTQPLCTILA